MKESTSLSGTKNDAIQVVAAEIRREADDRKAEARTMRTKHQFFTVMTILLGVAAPAIVTYDPPSSSGFVI